MRAKGLPAVVLAGRVNAGKSTLFNRIARGGRAITSAIPGTTRDLNFARASHDDREFVLVDSGGLELGGRERMTERIVSEALAAVGMADLVVFLLDGRRRLQRGRPGSARADSRHRMSADRCGQQDRSARAGSRCLGLLCLGADELFFISAAHGHGVDELLDEIVARLPEREGRQSAELPI